MDDTHEEPPAQGLAKLGLGLIVAGLVLLVVFVLLIADAGYGRDPHREFGQRRSYNMVKRDVHTALPRMVPLALLGGLLLYVGTRLRRTDDDA